MLAQLLIRKNGAKFCGYDVFEIRERERGYISFLRVHLGIFKRENDSGVGNECRSWFFEV